MKRLGDVLVILVSAGKNLTMRKAKKKTKINGNMNEVQQDTMGS